MAQYVDPDVERESVTVGILTTVIVPVTSLRGAEAHVVELINDHSEDLTATIEASFDGTLPFATVPDDTFAPLAAGTSRFAFIDAKWQYYRIVGTYPATPGTTRKSVAAQKQLHR